MSRLIFPSNDLKLRCLVVICIYSFVVTPWRLIVLLLVPAIIAKYVVKIRNACAIVVASQVKLFICLKLLARCILIEQILEYFLVSITERCAAD